MKAYGITQYGGPETLELIEPERPEPGPAELLVRVKAAAVNPVDWKIRQGHLAQHMPLEFPAVLGREVSGVVEQVGQDVQGFAVGDEVFGNTAPTSGGFAEYAVTTAAVTAKKPVHVSWLDASTLAVAAATAYDGVRQLALEPGQTLLITGAGGGVGVAATQIARDLGLNVIAIASEGKRELVQSLGATLVAYGDGVADRVRQLLPDGVDGILDLTGGDGLRDVAVLVADRSKLISASDPRTAAELGGSALERADDGGTLPAVAQLVADGKLDPRVEDVVPLDRAAEALHAVEAGHARGKVVIQVS